MFSTALTVVDNTNEPLKFVLNGDGNSNFESLNLL
jgi:hypothetical protein